MLCVTTRFRLRRIWHLAPMWWRYHRMRRDLSAAPGLIRHAFLVQSPRTVMTLSIWESERAITDFTNVKSHLLALRRARRWCSHVWSAYWYADAVSKSAHEWPGERPWPAFVPHAWHANRLKPAALEEARG